MKFESFDILASEIKFKLFGKDKFQTNLGSFLSLMIIAIIIAFACFLVMAFINKTTPSLNYSRLYSQNPIHIDLSKDFPVMIAVIKRGVVFFDNPDSYFTISSLQANFTYVIDSTGKNATYMNVTDVYIQKCSDEFMNNTFGPYSEMFKSNKATPDISSYYCLPLGQNNSRISGVYATTPSEYLDFSINFCNNKTSNGTCKSKEEIIAALSSVYILITFPDFYMDPYNANSPGVYYLRTQVYPISANFYKRYYMVYKRIQFTTDTGLVYEDLKDQFYYQFDYLDKDMNPVVKGITPDTFAEVTFCLYSNIYDYYFRSYKKAATIIAEIGGALNAITVIATLLNYYFHNKYNQLKIFNLFCKQLISADEIKNSKKDIGNIMENNKGDNKTNQVQHKTLKDADCSQDHLKVQNYVAGQKKEIKTININKDKKHIMINNLKLKSLSSEDCEDFKQLVGVKVRFIDLILCWRNSKLKKTKLEVSKKITNEILDLSFVFGNLIAMKEKHPVIQIG